MDCRRLEKWVWQEGAGNLPAGAVEHSATCSDCRTLIERVRLLDRSIGASVTPDPDESYWDALALRIAGRLDQPIDRVIELVPGVPAWRRLVGRILVPATAVALLAVVANQRTTMAPNLDGSDIARVAERIAVLSTPRHVPAGDLDQRFESPTSTQEASVFAEGEMTAAPSIAPSPIMTQGSGSGFAVVEDNALPPTIRMKAAASLSEPPAAQEIPSTVDAAERVWPERQVTIMGAVDSNSPTTQSADDRRLAAQDPFGAYERQMADAEQGVESVSTFASPGRLLDGPTATSARGSERLTPAEQMRRFDEMAELHDLIEKIESIPESSRAMSQWTQWSTAWYRLGMLSQQSTVLDSAITAVAYFESTVPMDSAAQAEWLVRRTHLVNRRSNFEH